MYDVSCFKPYHSTSYDYRRDDRSDEAFNADIRTYGEAEGVWMAAFVTDLNARQRSSEYHYQFKPYAQMDSNVIYRDKLRDRRCDFVLTGKNMERVVECKTGPEWLEDFQTYKVSSLQMCLENKAWLLFARVKHYFLWQERAIQRMLNDYPHRAYRGFAPGKLAVRIPSADILSFLADGVGDKKEWRSPAKEFLQRPENVSILSKRR